MSNHNPMQDTENEDKLISKNEVIYTLLLIHDNYMKNTSNRK